MAFRKFGGLEYTKSNNYVSSNTTNNMKLSITDSLGKLNTKIVVDSHMDLNNQSMFNVGDIYFSNGTSIINGNISSDLLTSDNKWKKTNTFDVSINALGGINAYYDNAIWNDAKSYFSNARIKTLVDSENSKGSNGQVLTSDGNSCIWKNGAFGPTGPTGPSGLDGAVGATGPSGLDGAVGATGPSGLDGATGPSGLDGADGATGPSGLDGAVGATGPTGPQAEDGYLVDSSGASGASGQIPIANGSGTWNWGFLTLNVPTEYPLLFIVVSSGGSSNTSKTEMFLSYNDNINSAILSFVPYNGYFFQNVQNNWSITFQDSTPWDINSPIIVNSVISAKLTSGINLGQNADGTGVVTINSSNVNKFDFTYTNSRDSAFVTIQTQITITW